MTQTRILEDLSARISDFLGASPAKDVEKNLRALLSAAFAKLNLATREELEIQAKVLARTREKLSELETRVAELEAKLGQDRKSTRLNSSHANISYAVFCLKKKTTSYSRSKTRPRQTVAPDK